jgi:predicted ATPase
VLAWQALTGVPAFPGTGASERIAATLECELDATALPAALPVAVRATVVAALSRDPSRRPAHGAALVAALGRTPVEPAMSEGALIGRARELALATSLLAHARLVTLTGAAGIGKTRLARELVAPAPHALWVEATACTDSLSLAATIASAAGLRVTDETALPAAFAAARIEPTVLVLDGPDEAMAPCAAIVPALLAASPDLRVVVAAREALRTSGEEQLRLTPLAVPDEETLSPARLRENDSVRLFLATALRVAPGASLDDADLVSIAGIVHESLATIAAELVADAPAGAAVRVALEASLARLELEPLRFLRALGVFRGGFSLQMAAAVATEDDDRFGALDALAQLLERALVTVVRADRGEPRYRLLEPVRRAAQARAEAAGESRRLGVRHRQAYLAAVEELAPALTGGASQSRALAWLEAEHENVLAAIAFDGGRDDDPQLALRLAGSAWWFWYVRGHFARGRAALELALARPGADAGTSARALALLAAGGLALFQGDRGAGRERSLAAVAAYEVLGDGLGLARALTGVALCDADDGRHAEAAAGYGRAIAIFRDHGDKRRLAATLNNLGVLERLRNDFAAARTHHAEALASQREAGDRDASIVTLLNLALADTRLGEVAAAAGHLGERSQRSVTCARVAPDRPRSRSRRSGSRTTPSPRGCSARRPGCGARSRCRPMRGGSR